MLAERGSATSVVSQTISRTRISVLTRNPGQDQIRSTQKHACRAGKYDISCQSNYFRNTDLCTNEESKPRSD
ncbi:hypothetical protein Y032_0729g1891 [Ancylostoma ceylanicum]|uniref:Uncharacterized protein n=1 Tax=Ancylostoma ceylanicum TaxID=53326 RepID=A0A016WG31_9BILA|nr:hypothetical protein Y032_0729g1891 [Ancylostoma ceylanicum]